MSLTNKKEIIEKNKKHILKFYTKKGFKEQIEYMIHPRCPSPYHAVKEMASGGCFLIYNGDIVKYLTKTLGLPSRDARGKEYDDMKSFELYCHLLARDGEKLYKEIVRKK